MRTVEIGIYKFNELTNDVKEKVINRFRENNLMPFLKDDLEEELKRLLKENNIDIINNYDFYFSLTNSQGDGFCFVGQFKYKKYRVIIIHPRRYYHIKSVDFEYILYEPYDKDGYRVEIPNDEYESIGNEFSSVYRDICNKVEKTGYKIIDDENSEEHIKEEIEVNEYEFYDNGDIYHKGDGKEVSCYGDYETKSIELWMGDDSDSNDFWHNIARNHYINIAKRDKEIAVNRLAETIKKYYEEENPFTTGAYADLLNAAIGRVNWHKIAEYFIDSVKEECDKMKN